MEAKKYACGRTIILCGEDRRMSINYVLSKARSGRHWIGGKKVGKVVLAQRIFLAQKNIGDDQT